MKQHSTIMKGLLFAVFLFAPFISSAENKVKITQDIPYLDVQHNGKTVRIERIQDTKNRLNNGFTKTSRVCPPFCVNPIEISPGVKTVAELELLNFLDTVVKENKGLLIDARMPEWFEKGTIPGSVNIPFTVLSKGFESKHTQRIITLLGGKKNGDDWNYDNARELLLFCNGLWCGQSGKAIRNLLELGYPAEKLRWYRGGMQAWESLGLTTITP